MTNAPETSADSVARALARIRSRVAAACERSGRRPLEVTLVGAAKRQSRERLIAARRAGLEVFGENRVQEAVSHRELLGEGPSWHLIGPLQSNKAKRAAEIFDVVESVDRRKIARALARAADLEGRRLPCFLEVNLGGETSKHGFAPGEAVSAAREIATSLDSLELRGLMAIPPQEDEPERSRRWFRELRRLRDDLSAAIDFPGQLSMGMSADFEIAIEEGATHVRIGTALFGTRPEADSSR